MEEQASGEPQQPKMEMEMERKALTMKLLVDAKSNRVLFAEAGKDVVDFILALLAMPVSSIVKVLTKDRMAGSLGSLYQSVEGLDGSYLQSDQCKAALLNPKVDSSPLTSSNLLLPAPTAANKLYSCPGGHYSEGRRCNIFSAVPAFSAPRGNAFRAVSPSAGSVLGSGLFRHSPESGECRRSYYTDVSGISCPGCNNQMTVELMYVDPKTRKVEKKANAGAADGLVKGDVTYTIMDDLTVTPMSTISSITLLNKFHVTDLGALKEKTVEIGFKEGRELLRCSLQSTTVLTDVFLVKKANEIKGE